MSKSKKNSRSVKLLGEHFELQQPDESIHVENYLVMSIFDLKAKQYSRPFFVKTKTEAIRSFEQEIIRPNSTSLIALYPADHILNHIGYFDSTGLIQPIQPLTLASGAEFVAPKN